MSEANIPIDISVRKLLDWLISRRICSRDWHENVVGIRERIGEAMQDMPENEAIKELLVGGHINYFSCLKIVEILKETEADSKNFFGQYGSKRMKDWTQIISDYEKGNVYLAESAQLLIQNVVYEIPGIKKNTSKLQTLQAECDKKEENARKRIRELDDDFRKQCKQLGVEGEKIKTEIIALARELPATYSRISEDVGELREASSLYEEFIQGQLDEGVHFKVVETLRFLIENGNTTVYQWTYGEKPIEIEDPVLHFTEDEEAAGEGGGDAIDFGDDDGGEIDFGGDDDIDFGGDDGEIDFGDSGAEIDFGDEAEVCGGLDLDSVDTSNIVLEEGGMAGGIARNDEALSILDNRRTRTIIVDELEELLGFLTQRLCETENESMRFSLGSGNQNHDPATLQTMISSIQRILSELRGVKVQQLQMIRDSPAYADRLADTLKQKLRLKTKVESSIDSLHQRKAESVADEQRGSQQLKVLQEKTVRLQEQIETDLSKRYKGRTVNISTK